MTLHPCTQCRRHIAATEHACPFCGTPRTRTVSRSSGPVGRASRAAVFASLSACWTGSDAPRQTAIEPVKQAVAAEVPSLRGVVLDDISGQPVANVSIELVGYTGDRIGSTTTNAKGEYQFAKVPPGEYQIHVRYGSPRSGSVMQHDVIVSNEPERFDITISTLQRAPIPKPYGAPPARRRVV